MSDLEPSIELAQRYWEYQRAWDADSASADDSYVHPVSGQVLSLYDVVNNDLAEDLDKLSALVTVLLACARSPRERAYIGTSILEDAERANGAAAIEVFARTPMTDDERRDILSGYWPGRAPR